MPEKIILTKNKIDTEFHRPPYNRFYYVTAFW